MGSLDTRSRLPPVLDFSVFRGDDEALRAAFLHSLNEACRDKGFFQITNHGIDAELQQRIFSAAKQLFDLPLEEKLKAKLVPGKSGRGYEMIGGQMLEPGSAPDTKEAIYLGEDLAPDHPRVVDGEYGCSPNLYPAILGTSWHDTCMEYWRAMTTLAQDVMAALALALGVDAAYFDAFTKTRPAATLRLIHYPPTPRTSARERGCGAHRDFGCVTLLLQDDVGGLQVQDEVSGEYLDVAPVPGAYVVNLGNLMARWTNHHFTSNTHRVLNFSPADRYSIPFFYNGNPGHILSTIPGLERRPAQVLQRKYGPVIPDAPYEPVLVKDFLEEQFVQSYKRAEEYKRPVLDVIAA